MLFPFVKIMKTKESIHVHLKFFQANCECLHLVHLTYSSYVPKEGFFVILFDV